MKIWNLAPATIVVISLLPGSVKALDTDTPASSLSVPEALSVWSLVKWAHVNCPRDTLTIIHYMMAAEIERSAPKHLLDQAEKDVPAAFVSKHGSVDAACTEMRLGIAPE